MSICCLSRFCAWKNSKCLKRFPSVRMPGEEFTKENIFDLEWKGARKLREEMAEKHTCPRKNTCLLFSSELLLLFTSTKREKKKKMYLEQGFDQWYWFPRHHGIYPLVWFCAMQFLLTSATRESSLRPASLTAQPSSNSGVLPCTYSL